MFKRFLGKRKLTSVRDYLMIQAATTRMFGYIDESKSYYDAVLICCSVYFKEFA